MQVVQQQLFSMCGAAFQLSNAFQHALQNCTSQHALASTPGSSSTPGTSARPSTCCVAPLQATASMHAQQHSTCTLRSLPQHHAALLCCVWYIHARNCCTREQQRSWLYRIRPSVTHEPFHPLNFPAEQLTADFSLGVVTPNQVSLISLIVVFK